VKLHDKDAGWGAFGAVIALFAARRAVAVDDPTGYRVFLKDGTSLVSDGEPAPREHGVVFSMPTLASVNDFPAPVRNLCRLRRLELDDPRRGGGPVGPVHGDAGRRPLRDADEEILSVGEGKRGPPAGRARL
jgi:hypothetical protein